MPSLTMEYNFRALTGQRITPGNTATAIGTNIIKYVEHKLHIEHSNMCLPEDDWDTLTEVNSHPVALAQCRGGNRPDRP